MRLYAGMAAGFVRDSVRNAVADKLKAAFFQQFQYDPGDAEVHSWQNSLRAMAQVVQYSELLDSGVILEYQLPLTSRRLDCLFLGHDREDAPQGVIVELKQWAKAEPASGANEVLTWTGGGQREVLHPSVQVGQYMLYLQDGHTAFHENADPVGLSACSYLHNYPYDPSDVIFSGKFAGALERCPLFAKDAVGELSGFLRGRLEAGGGAEVLRRVEEGDCRPSKKLLEHVGSMIKGKPEYVLLDEQMVVYDKVLSCARRALPARGTTVLIVHGGPGTGKSVIAINLMADLSLAGFNAHYATGSKAFTGTLRRIVGARGSVQFKYFNSYQSAGEDVVDVLICDEAHRIREFSWDRFTRREARSNTPQIRELLKAARVAVFFIDDDQVVRPNEIGSARFIRAHAEEMGCPVSEYRLEAQFRCQGSAAFVNWVNNTLGIRPTANVLWGRDEAFEFRIIPTPEGLEEAIREKADAGHSARLTAGFCWKWSNPTPEGFLVNDVVIGSYARPWNARSGRKTAPGIPKERFWAHDPAGIDQVGCIYTAQGFEFDYVGVIFGKDLIHDPDASEWRGVRAESADTVVRRSGGKFTELVKNTYRVLLTRGLKGCFVHFLDKDTERFFRSRMR